jgi:predicted RNase H-like nuclease
MCEVAVHHIGFSHNSQVLWGWSIVAFATILIVWTGKMLVVESSTNEVHQAISDEVFVGVDACRSGWIALRGSQTPMSMLTMSLHHNANDLVRATSIASIVGVDMPIGLSESGLRACDGRARAVLGRRGCTLFNAPTRILFDVSDFSVALALSRAATGRGLSIQSFNLLARIADLDRALMTFECPIYEVHPEVSFTMMAGEPLPSKKSAIGVEARRDALASRWLDVDHLLATRPSGVAIDDVLDAAAVLWTTLRIGRGEAVIFGDGTRDAHGIEMAIRA